MENIHELREEQDETNMW